MKTKIFTMMLLCACTMGWAQAQNALYEKSKVVLTCFEKENFAGLEKYYDETMKKALPAEKTKEVWTQINQQTGPFIKGSTMSDTTYKDYRIVYTICIFKNARLKMKVVFDKNKKVAGLFFVPENAPKP
jgi:hypothetical protein